MKRGSADRITRRASKIVGQPVKIAIPATATQRPEKSASDGVAGAFDRFMRRVAGNSAAIIVAVLPDEQTAILEVKDSNPGLARSVLSIHKTWPTPVDDTDSPEGDIDSHYRVDDWVFALSERMADRLTTSMRQQDTPTAPQDAEEGSTGWAAVADAFVEQMTLPAEFLKPEQDGRTRSSRQCQRLLPDVYVALGTPVRTRPSDGSKSKEMIIAFTDEGPWLLDASKGNSGLPRSVVGPIEHPTPVSLEPFDNGAGLLRLGDNEYRVPIAHCRSLRALIVEMSTAPAEANEDPGEQGTPDAPTETSEAPEPLDNPVDSFLKDA